MIEKNAEQERILRAALSSRAAQAPDSGPLADRIRRTAAVTESRRQRRRSLAGVIELWWKPVAIACLVLVIGAGAYGLTKVNRTASDSGSSTSAAGKNSFGGATMAGGAGSTAASGASSDVPVGFRATDLTFVSDDEGWAIGSAPCSAGFCVVVVHTSDGGASWNEVGVPQLTAPTRAIAAAAHIRFADAQHGYIFGTKVYATNDGGVHWSDQTPAGEQNPADGRFDLEVADGAAVALLTSQQTTSVTVWRSVVGSGTWSAGQDLTALPRPKLPGGGVGAGASLQRSGVVVAVLDPGLQSGTGLGYSALYISTNDGRTWTSRGEACPQGAGTAFDTTAFSVNAVDSITLLCTPRFGDVRPFTVTSTDRGKTFSVATPKLAPTTECAEIVGASAGVQFCVTNGRVLVSRGASSSTWTATSINDPGLTPARGAAQPTPSFFGFESGTTGRYLSIDGQTLWTTTDAGAHWTPSGFR